MKTHNIFVSLIASSLLLQAQDSEVQIDFSASSSDLTHKTPTWNPSGFNSDDFKWDQDKGVFIINSNSNKGAGSTPPSLTPLVPPPNVIATFSSDKKDEGILTLKNFNFISGYKNSELKLPTLSELSQIQFGSKLTIKNADSSGTPFKSFILGGYQNNTGNINLYSGTNLAIEGFTQTTLKGGIYIRSGNTRGLDSNNNEINLYTGTNDSVMRNARKTSLSIKSQSDYSLLSMEASLNLETNNNDKTQEKAIASFSSDIQGDTKILGSVYIADKAEVSFRSSNHLEIGSSINIYAQEAKKITEDSLGNQSVAQSDREGAKKINLTLEATKISLNGGINVGTGARELVTKVDSNGITKINTYATDIGSTASITANIDYKGTNSSSKPEDWVEAQKAQFIQGGGSMRIGKNSDIVLRVINNENAFVKQNDSQEQEYAMNLTHVSIEEQKENNKILNFDAQVQVKNSSAGSPPNPIGVTKANGGKILLNGSFDLASNARALIQAYDGIDTGSSAKFTLGKDSLLWLKGTQDSGLSMEFKGSINANGGAIVLGDTYKNQSSTAEFETQLINTSSTTISNSMRNTTDQAPTRPPTRGIDQENHTPRELDPAGVFLLGKSNVFDNQGTLTFDGGGNLSTMTSRQDSVVRDILITNTKNKKGIIQANGAKNAITSSGSITLISQDIALSSKTLDDEKKTLQEGELILYSNSLNASSFIQLGSNQPNSGKDKVSISGGTFKIVSQIAGVKSYNLRLTKTNLDLSSLALNNQLSNANTSDASKNAKSTNSDDVSVAGAFVNLRKLQLGGNVNIFVNDSQGIIANGDARELKKDFVENLAIFEVQGSNQIISNTKESQTRFSFDNYAILNLKSSASLYVGGDINHAGSLVFSADQFGMGSLILKGDLNIDMTNHQERGETVNPLIAINHTNFYSLLVDQVYMLIKTQEGNINYRVGSALLKPNTQDGNTPQPRDSELTYDSQKALLKNEIEDYINGKNAYEGNENKLGIFLNGVALIGNDFIGFGVIRSEEISQITIDGTPTGVIDQYMKILQNSDGAISEKKTQEMMNILNSNDSKAMQALNNALEAKNGLELGILKDIGSYNSASLVSVANQIQQAMRSVSDISRPVIEDFRKMKVIREIAVQNRMVRSSNPYTAQMELESIVSEISPYFENQKSSEQKDTQSVSHEQTHQVLDTPAPFLFDDRIAFRNNIWFSAITSTSKTSLDNSSLYGMSLGYEYMPIPNILFGIYGAYGYSTYKANTLKNSAHNLDLSAYVRLYYGASEFDVTLSYLHGFNQAQTQFSNSLDQSFNFGTDSFDLNIRYGYIFKTPLKGFLLKPLANFTFYGVGLPTLIGEGSSNSIILNEQMQGGMEFGAGLEFRQYLSAFSYIYFLPSLEYNLYESKAESSVAFVGASNKMHYGLSRYGKWNFSLYAGGEGYINQAFSINVSAGYRGALDTQEHNLGISAGLKYKF